MTNGSSEGSDEIDPFAPFDDYDDVGFDVNNATASSSSTSSQPPPAPSSNSPHSYYDPPAVPVEETLPMTSSVHPPLPLPPMTTTTMATTGATATTLINGAHSSASIAERQRIAEQGRLVGICLALIVVLRGFFCRVYWNGVSAIASSVRLRQAASAFPSHPEDPVPQRLQFTTSPEAHQRPIVIPQPPPPAG